MVVQRDGVAVVRCRRVLLVQGPAATKRERVGGELGRIFERGRALVIGAPAAVIDCRSGTQVGLRGQR